MTKLKLINNENVVLFNKLMNFTDVEEECKTCLRENFGEQALVDALAGTEIATLDVFGRLWVSKSFKGVGRDKQNAFC